MTATEIERQRQKAIIKLCLYDLFIATDQKFPHETKIEQTAERIIEHLNSEVKDGNN